MFHIPEEFFDYLDLHNSKPTIIKSAPDDIKKQAEVINKRRLEITSSPFFDIEY